MPFLHCLRVLLTHDSRKLDFLREERFQTVGILPEIQLNLLGVCEHAVPAHRQDVALGPVQVCRESVQQPAPPVVVEDAALVPGQFFA